MVEKRIRILFGVALIALLGALLLTKEAKASTIVFTFNSPSFSGVGQSSHYLTIENLEKSRKDAIIAKAEAEERRLENELKNTATPRYTSILISFFPTFMFNVL